MKITKLGVSLALLIALALAARFTDADKSLRASSRPSTPSIQDHAVHPIRTALD
jgi:hypothetical protein